jgi:hypothetical protein
MRLTRLSSQARRAKSHIGGDGERAEGFIIVSSHVPAAQSAEQAETIATAAGGAPALVEGADPRRLAST